MTSTLKYSILSLMLLFLSSCALDDEPTDSISPGNAFRNLEDIELGLFGAYASLTTSLMESATIVGDEVRIPAENTVSNTDAYRWLYNSGSGSVTGAFYTFYQAIDRANRVLESIDGIQVTASEEGLKNQYKAELLAIRAFAHFELLRGYASGYEEGDMGVPYMKSSEVGYPARNSVGSNYQDIAQDLMEAKQLIPASFSDKTRITSLGISAIQARLALYSKQWQDAITFSSEVIQNNPLATGADFVGIWRDVNDTEVLWKLDRVTGDSPYGSLFFRQSGGIALYVPSFKILEEFEAVQEQDIRFEAYIEHQPERSANNPGKSNFLVRKFEGSNPSEPGLTDIKLFRTGEMFLIRAESYTELEQLNQALADLNNLRAARIAGYSDVNITGKVELIAAIYAERFKELAFEGHRFFDLKRRNLPVERLQEDLLNTAQQQVMTPNDAQYNFPIPADELAVNDNMEQNPNY